MQTRVTWRCFVLKYLNFSSLIFASQQELAKLVISAFYGVKVWFAKLHTARAGIDAAWIRVSRSLPPQPHPLPWTCPIVSIQPFKSLDVLKSIMHGVREMNDPFIPLSLCILSSEGKPAVIHLPLGMIVPPTPGLVVMVSRAHRSIQTCNILLCCSQLLHFGQSNSLFPDWHLKTYLWFILPQVIFWKSSALLTGWYLPYIPQITNSASTLPGAPPRGAQVITCCFSLRAF